MKKKFGLLLLLVLFVSSSSSVFSRGGSNPSVTVVPIITHGTCLIPEGSIEYEIVVSSHWDNEASLNNIQLLDHSNPVQVIDEHMGPMLTGSFNSLLIGGYTFSGSVSVLNSDGMWVSVPFSSSVWVGIETVWTEKIDMISGPNSYSAKRNASIASYGGVRSSNGITSGDGWIEMSAVYGTTSDNRVYFLIGANNLLGAFDPSATIQYLEFYEGSSGNGIQIKYLSAGGSYQFFTLSTDPSDKIRLVRTASTLTIQKNNSTTTIFTLPVADFGPMNIVSRSLALNDGCLDVVSSFSCTTDKNVYAKIERNLTGVKYLDENSVVKFYVTEEYNNQSPDLIYNVYSEGDRVNPVNMGTQSLPIHEFGDNRYDLDVSALATGTYILEVKNEKKEKFYLRFIKQ